MSFTRKFQRRAAREAGKSWGILQMEAKRKRQRARALGPHGPLDAKALVELYPEPERRRKQRLSR